MRILLLLLGLWKMTAGRVKYAWSESTLDRKDRAALEKYVLFYFPVFDSLKSSNFGMGYIAMVAEMKNIGIKTVEFSSRKRLMNTAIVIVNLDAKPVSSDKIATYLKEIH